MLEEDYDHGCIACRRPALDAREPIALERELRQLASVRSAGCCRSAIARPHGEDGLPDGTIRVTFSGSAGQSFGAWLARRGRLHAVRARPTTTSGKGLSGGTC